MTFTSLTAEQHCVFGTIWGLRYVPHADALAA